MTAYTRLLDLADRVAQLRPDWQSQERFHELRSDLAAELRDVAYSLNTRSAAWNPPTTTVRRSICAR